MSETRDGGYMTKRVQDAEDIPDREWVAAAPDDAARCDEAGCVLRDGHDGLHHNDSTGTSWPNFVPGTPS